MRIGLALSGGGFRATLYHLGVVRFLRDSNLLSSVSHITAVSGGSVLAAHLVTNWDRYRGTDEQFDAAARQILDFVSLDVRTRIVRRYPWLIVAGLGSLLMRRRKTRLLTRTGLLERYYQQHLFGDICLHQLPEVPELHILSTNVSEGGLSSFTRQGLIIERQRPDGSLEVRRHRAGLTTVATAVAASSAFPAFFPPLELRADDIGAEEGEFHTQHFTDGGVFDNLGVRKFHHLKAVMRNSTQGDGGAAADGLCDVILASDVGKLFSVYGPERAPGFLTTALRSSDILMNRVWQLERDHFAHERQCHFAASADLVSPETDPTALHPEIQVQVSRIRTDMDRFSQLEIGGLIRHGYCVARQACRSLPAPLNEHVSDEPPWDPTTKRSDENTDSDGSSGNRFENVSQAARQLQGSARRRLWSSLIDLRDWVTWLYIPLIVVAAGVLPFFTYRTYRHARLNATLTRAVTDMREDFSRMLDLLEHGTPRALASMKYEDAEAMSPLLADEGLDIISDNRITDLREWFDEGNGSARRVYVCRHVLVRKTSDSRQTAGLKLLGMWDLPELIVQCPNRDLRPKLQRFNQSATNDAQGPFSWEVVLDFSDVPVGETVDVRLDLMLTATPDPDRVRNKRWWHFQVDANPEIVTSWILLPADRPHAEFSVVRFRNDEPNVPELVKPTHRTSLNRGTVINWSVVHPKPGYTYSAEWSWPE